MKRSQRNEGVFLTERVPGGADLIVDNFSDTGLIDREPVRRVQLPGRRGQVEDPPAESGLNGFGQVRATERTANPGLE